ncbi:unnamed protein product, partial [Prunus brigantina]
MALVGKLETEVEINTPADKFYKIQGVELHEGDWETAGSLTLIYMHIDRSSLSLKETVEAIDEENKTVTFQRFGWRNIEALQELQETEKTNGGSLMEWILDYEKVKDEIPAPQ